MSNPIDVPNYLTKNTDTAIDGQHFKVYESVAFYNHVVFTNIFLTRFYNCLFLGGLTLQTNANAIVFRDCGFFNPSTISDAYAVNITGGDIEGITGGVGLTISNSKLITVHGVYFENNQSGDILIDNDSLFSSIDIGYNHFNACEYGRKSIQVNGVSRPKVHDNYFRSNSVYNLIDIRCRTKRNTFDNIFKYLVNF